MNNTTCILSLWIVILFTSCIDRLDIEPEQAISTEVALSNEEGVKTALVGAYSLWANTPFFSGNTLLNSDLLIDADNLLWTTFFTSLTEIYNKQISTDNPAVEDMWINSYRLINQTNSILAALDVFIEDDPNTVAAGARFLRGLVYLDLVNLFGKSWGDGNPSDNLGVPIVTMPSEQNLQNPLILRNTVNEVYELIQEDLLFAKAHLPSQNGVFATTYAAGALLSRMYLMQEEYGSALIEADNVINSGIYNLVSSLPEAFNASNNTTEDVFSIQITSQDRSNHLNFAYSGQVEGGIGFIGISDEHVAKYHTEDLRRTLFYFDARSGTRRTAKWRNNGTNDGNITLIRLAEMYLTRAESRFIAGDKIGAAEDLTVIRNRAGLSSLNESEISLDLIIKERFLELAFEGHNFRDTKRTRQSVGDLEYDDPKLIFPIPKRELDVNSALIQNDGY